MAKKVFLFANTDWYLYNFRISLAKRLHVEGWEVVLIAPPGKYHQKLRDMGFRCIQFNFSTRSTNVLRELFTIWRIVKLYRRERPSLVHHFTIKCVLYGSLAARMEHNISVVNAIPGLGYIFSDSGMKARILRHIVKPFYRFVLDNTTGRVIFQNSDDLDIFLRMGLVRKSSTYLIRGSGVNCDHFKPDGEYRQNLQGNITVLFASRMLKEKGVYELMEAASLIKKRGYHITVLLAGDIYPDNPSSLTKKDIDKINQYGVATYLGHVEDMRSLIAACDIVVLPTYYREGTPRILIEAAAMEKPIITTDIPGCRGLVQHGINGLLVPIKNALLLADAIEKLAKDEELRKRMGKAGREIVLKEFEESIVINKTMEVYRQLIHSRTS